MRISQLKTYVLLFFLLHILCSGFEDRPASRRLLEDNINQKIIISEKLPDRLYNAAVKAYIFDENEITNLPVDTIPDLLRYAPGVHVQQADNGTWGVGIRGMNSRYLSRVSFTVDEQNIYAGLFSGLFGSQHDLLMEDIATIEVVYGPGGILWGTNAMNGMVNVVMKSAFDTIGSHNKFRYGTKKSLIQSRYGWNMGKSGAIRLYGKASHTRSNESLFNHMNDRDTWRMGWRYDNMINPVNLVSFSGEIYGSRLGIAQYLPDSETGFPSILSGYENQVGANAQFKWTHENSSGSIFSLRSWVGMSEYETTVFKADVSSVGISGTYNYSVEDEYSIVVRGNFVGRRDDTRGYGFAVFEDKIDNSESNLSVQGNWNLSPSVKFSMGGNFRYNTPEDQFAFLPVLSLIAKVGDCCRVWYSYSEGDRSYPEAMRRIKAFPWIIQSLPPDQQVSITTPYGTVTPKNNYYFLTFSEEISSESVKSHQIGFEKLFRSKINLDFTLFSNEYSDVYASYIGDVNVELGVLNPYWKTQLFMGNGLDGHSWGGELNLDWKFSDIIHFKVGYAYIKSDWNNLPPPKDNPDAIVSADSATDLSNYGPTHSGNLRFVFFPNSDLRANLGYRYAQSHVDSVFGKQETTSLLDLRVVWDISERFQASVLIRNMLDDKIDEGSVLYHNLSIPTFIEQDAFFELSYQF